MHQRVPFPRVPRRVPVPKTVNGKVKGVVFIFSTEIEYAKQDIVWECADCCRMFVTLVWITQSQFSMRSLQW